MDIACIDMEGVLIPELWPNIALRTGIDELEITTREEPDYVQLVERRIHLLRHHGLRLADLQVFVNEINPLPGAKQFLAALRLQFRVVLVSDAFEQMLLPLWHQLGEPELRCHRFHCDAHGFVCSAHYARLHGKHEVIDEFSAMGCRTIAVGDAFNDLSMLHRATLGFLFRPSLQTALAAGGLSIAMTYSDILSRLNFDAVASTSGE